MTREFIAVCAICGHQGVVRPADIAWSGKVRGCLTSRGEYPRLPEVWICDIHWSDGSLSSPSM